MHNKTVQLNPEYLNKYSHVNNEFCDVLHIAHAQWHGIRNATAFCPGKKTLIDEKIKITKLDLELLENFILQHQIKNVIFQGFSTNCKDIVVHLHSSFGADLKLFVILHNNSTQFDHQHEVDVNVSIINLLQEQKINRVGSVKPDYHCILEDCWKETIINFCPNLPLNEFEQDFNLDEAFIPLPENWRKNLYTNIIAAANFHKFETIKILRNTKKLPFIKGLNHRLQQVGFLDQDKMFYEMSRSCLVLSATLSECQPMTELEALGVMTPAITGPFGLKEFKEDPYVKLKTIYELDNPKVLTDKIHEIFYLREHKNITLMKLIKEHKVLRNRLAVNSYLKFLEKSLNK